MLKINDLVKVRDWSCSKNCNNETSGHIPYLPFFNGICGPEINEKYINCCIFKIVGYGSYPNDIRFKKICPNAKYNYNNVMIENLLTKEIFFINRKFITKVEDIIYRKFKV